MKKHPFTLVEILLVLTLLAMVGGAFALFSARSLGRYTFEKEVDMIASKLLFAEEIMMDHGVDVSCVFAHNCFSLIASRPLPIDIERLMKKEEKLKAIEEISFEGKSLLFEGATKCCPEGRLHLKGKRCEMTLCIPPFPGRINKELICHAAQKTLSTH